MKNTILTTCSIAAFLATAGAFAQDDCKWDVNIMGLVKVGKNKKGEECTNIGFGLIKTTGDKVNIGYGLIKADGENVEVPKKITLFGKEIELNNTVSLTYYDDARRVVTTTPNTVTVSHSDCKYGCVNGIGRDTVKKEYILSRKKKNFDLEYRDILYTLECDKILVEAINDGLMLGVNQKNQVHYDAPRNTSMKFSKTGNKPLCTLLAIDFKKQS